MYIEGGNKYSDLFNNYSQPVLPPCKYQIYPKTLSPIPQATFNLSILSGC